MNQIPIGQWIVDILFLAIGIIAFTDAFDQKPRYQTISFTMIVVFCAISLCASGILPTRTYSTPTFYTNLASSIIWSVGLWFFSARFSITVRIAISLFLATFSIGSFIIAYRFDLGWHSDFYERLGVLNAVAGLSALTFACHRLKMRKLALFSLILIPASYLVSII